MPYYNNGKAFLTINELRLFVAMDAILDGTKGGLIIGNTHDILGIKLIMETAENKYEIIGEIEGWEYLMNPFATSKYRNELHLINDELKNSKKEFVEYPVTDSIDKLNAEPFIEGISFTSKIILLGKYPQFVVNKYSTKEYIEQLDKMNKGKN